MKGFFAEFKKFISRGNVIDMAVGVIVGSSFTAIVNSLVNDIFMHLVGMITGGVNFATLNVTIPASKEGADPVVLNYGNFIQNIVNFILVAFCLFLVVKAINNAKKKEEPKPAAPKAPEIPADVKLLTEIRDLLKNEK